MQIAEELRRKGKTRSDSLSFAGERFANSSSKNQPSLGSLLILIKKSCKCCLLKVVGWVSGGQYCSPDCPFGRPPPEMGGERKVEELGGSLPVPG